MHELIFDADRSRWFLSGPAGLVRIVNPDTLNAYRHGVEFNGARLTQPLPEVWHGAAAFDAACAARIVPNVAI